MIRRYALPAIAALVFALTGHSLLGAPSKEVVCSLSALPAVCHDEGCTLPFVLKIGNTGKENISRIAVQLPGAWEEKIVMEPALRRFGKLRGEYVVEDDGRMSFGPLEATKWVEMSVVLQQPGRELSPLPLCTQLVTSSEGKVLVGSPELLRLGRFFYGLLAFFI